MFGRSICFEPDGHYDGVPYRAIPNGGVEALINGKIIKYASVDDFVAGQPATARSSTQTSAPTAEKVAASKPSSKSNRGGCGCLVIILLFVGFIVFVGHDGSDTSNRPTASYAQPPTSQYSSSANQRIVDVINREFGGVCSARLEGFFSNTLRIDWRASTTKLHSITVFAAIGKSKETLYGAGIRYLKFPNDAGGYNVIDWKTGEKTSISERAPYYF